MILFSSRIEKRTLKDFTMPTSNRRSGGGGGSGSSRFSAWQDGEARGVVHDDVGHGHVIGCKEGIRPGDPRSGHSKGRRPDPRTLRPCHMIPATIHQRVLVR